MQQRGVPKLLAAGEFELRLRLGDSRSCGLDVAGQRHLLAPDDSAARGEIPIVERGEILATRDRVTDIGADLLNRRRDACGERHRHSRLHGTGSNYTLSHLSMHYIDDRYSDSSPEPCVDGDRSGYYYQPNECQKQNSVSPHVQMPTFPIIAGGWKSRTVCDGRRSCRTSDF